MDYTKQLDYSSLSTYISCPRKFFFNYVLSYQSVNPKIDLVFGSAWHYGLEVAYTAWKEDTNLTETDLIELSITGFNTYWKVEGEPNWPDPDQIFPKSPGNAANMYSAYWQRYYPIDRDKKILGIELPFNLNIPDTSILYTGRIDLAFLNSSNLEIVDHKTAKSVNKITLTGFISSLQTSGYLTIGKLYYDRIAGMYYRVALCQKSKVAHEEFEVVKLDHEIERFLTELSYWAKTISGDCIKYETALQDDANFNQDYTPNIFPRTPGYACTAFFSPCPYLDLCMMKNNPLYFHDKVPQGFKVEEWNPEEHEEKIKNLIAQVKKD